MMCLAKGGNLKSDRIHKFKNRHDHIGKLIVLSKLVAFSKKKMEIMVVPISLDGC